MNSPRYLLFLVVVLRSPGFCVLGGGEAACRRRGCSGSPSSACFSSGILNPFQMTVLLGFLLACVLQLFLFHYASVCLLASSEEFGLCCVLALCAVSALLAFKRAIYDDPLSKLSDWNSRDKDPCTWSGVGCSAFNRQVVTL